MCFCPLLLTAHQIPCQSKGTIKATACIENKITDTASPPPPPNPQTHPHTCSLNGSIKATYIDGQTKNQCQLFLIPNLMDVFPHTHTHTYAHIHTHKHACMHAHTQAHTHTHNGSIKAQVCTDGKQWVSVSYSLLILNLMDLFPQLHHLSTAGQRLLWTQQHLLQLGLCQ